LESRNSRQDQDSGKKDSKEIIGMLTGAGGQKTGKREEKDYVILRCKKCSYGLRSIVEGLEDLKKMHYIDNHPYESEEWKEVGVWASGILKKNPD